MLRIFFSHDDVVPLFLNKKGSRFGGAELQFYSLAEELSRKEDVFIKFLVRDKKICLPKKSKVAFEYSPRLVQRGIPLISRFVNNQRIRQAYGNVGDAVFIHIIASQGIFQNYNEARRLGMKFVFQLSCDEDITGSFFDDASRQRYFRILRQSDAIVAQSKSQQKALKKIHDLDSVIIQNGLPDSSSKGVGDISVQSILWVGRSVALKQPWIFIELARRLSNEKFVMVLGADNDDLGRWLKKSAAQIPNLSILEDVDNGQIHQLLSESKLLVNTSAVEGYPMSFVESMRAGVPIASLSVDPDQVISSSGLGLYGGNDIELFLKQLEEVLSDSARMREMGTLSREFYAKNHDIEAVGNLYYDLLISTVRNR